MFLDRRFSEPATETGWYRCNSTSLADCPWQTNTLDGILAFAPLAKTLFVQITSKKELLVLQAP